MLVHIHAQSLVKHVSVRQRKCTSRGAEVCRVDALGSHGRLTLCGQTADAALP